MSYYRIKCPICLSRINMDDVLYYVLKDDLKIDVTAEENKGISTTSKKRKPKTGTAFEDDDENETFDDTVSSDNNSDAQGELLTAAQIKDRSEKCEEIRFKVTVPKKAFIHPDITDETNSEIVGDKDEDLIVGLDVTRITINDNRYSGKIMKRCCPHCTGTNLNAKKLLPDNAGKIPFFTVAMLGHSTAGKTTFLTFQKYSMSNLASSIQNNERKKNKFDMELPDCVITQLAYMGHISNPKEDIIDLNYKEVEKTGIIPGTTEGDTIPPSHCLQISVHPKGNNSVILGQCIVCFKDVLGEYYSGIGGRGKREKLIKEAHQFCLRSDGMFVFSDPFALQKFRSSVIKEMRNKVVIPPENSAISDIDSMDTSEAADDTIFNILRIFQDINILNKPVVCILAKADELISEHFDPYIAPDSYVRAGNGYINYQNFNEWQQINSDTRNALNELDNGGNWSQTLFAKFPNALHVPVSSVGSELVIVKTPVKYNDEENKIDYTTIRPKLVRKEDWLAYASADNNAEKEEIIRRFIDFKPQNDQINPRYISLPLIYLLMGFKMLPNYNEKSLSNRDEVIHFFEEYMLNYKKDYLNSEEEKSKKHDKSPVSAYFKEIKKMFSDILGKK